MSNEYIDIVVNETRQYTDVVINEARQYVDVVVENIIERIVEADPYIKTLSGLTDTIDQDEHGLSIIRGLRVNKPTGELVELEEIYNGTTVTINSNILLDNHILTIY